MLGTFFERGVKVDIAVQTQVYLLVLCTWHILLLFITSSVMNIFIDWIASINPVRCVYTFHMHYNLDNFSYLCSLYILENVAEKLLHYGCTFHTSTCRCWSSAFGLAVPKLSGWSCYQQWWGLVMINTESTAYCTRQTMGGWVQAGIYVT